MKSFKRVLEYIWPQWYRLTTILVSVVIIGALFAFSIATILPLLKVMMGEEGLHGWVDRIISQERYDVKFYLPDSISLSSSEDLNAVYHLRITWLDEEGPVGRARLKREDMIVGAGSLLLEDVTEKISSLDLNLVL